VKAKVQTGTPHDLTVVSQRRLMSGCRLMKHRTVLAGGQEGL